MDKVLSPRVRYSLRMIFLSLTVVLSCATMMMGEISAQEPAKKQATPSVSTKGSAPTAGVKKESPAQKTEKAEEAKDAKDDGGAEEAEQPLDPSQTKKSIPSEVFRDPRAEAILDVNKYQQIKLGNGRPLTPIEIDTFRQMASNPGATVDETLITKVLDALVMQLTDRKNIQALIDPGGNPQAAAAKAIQNATSLLLEAVFTSRSARNNRFIDTYNKILLQKLSKLANHHLIPRVQAMIVLGQTGNREALKFFLDQIKNPDQTALAKLWALRGISNIKKYGRPVMTTDLDISTARAVADLLENDKDLPWPAQVRALEVLGDLRQGHSAANPKNLEIANVAMKFLVDPKLKLEVRAEAARALGMMQISQVVNDYNYSGIAMSAGELAVELGDKIAKSYTDNPLRSEYYTSFLIGPVIEAFEGTPGSRGGGLLRSAPQTSQEKIRELVNLIKGIAKPSVELVRVGKNQAIAKQSEIESRVASLKEYIQKNAPKDRRLIPEGPDPKLAEGPGGK